ncbi:hypothetical protein AQJ43_36750 [Streptomyces avermitilis]|uniref:Uncharacterized protein n=2 Tax=Streptomyces avermitilis TaxID=33903 RepID=A0A143T0P6_STRAW|nr:hypothetical protein [Streptomyces avermitilis]KUN48321.1 hypothetical protein AQJ43_36750 [Streptomyces avermitilis]BAU77583.1 hypothetical protein SAVERM_2p140 [Streptomyces avermitilis MA-4680 = NBRC 14893]GDY70250.1 hypothetical protein SAV14893_096430 [Streptomyces avermitilis]GDY80558.1 hypothetical protein SAV31267_100430 [Streptomyces avermitilis]
MDENEFSEDEHPSCNDQFSEDEQPSGEATYIVRTPSRPTGTDLSPQPAGAPPTGQDAEFLEDLIPDDQAEFVENFQPDTKDPVKKGKPETIDETRRTLAVGMLWLVAVIAVLPTIALVAAHWTHFSTDAYRELGLVFTPVVALASAAFGFFFASDERHRS